jgi:putative copper resistance protein D
MTVHFLATGYLFFWVLIGVDPGPRRPNHVLRLLLLLATLAFHAFFGLAIMSSSTVVAHPWWIGLGYTDEAALLADQAVGGGIAWSTGEIPAVLVALVVVAQWVRSEERAAKRYDRRADRDGEAELGAYNDRLARLEENGGRRPDGATTGADARSSDERTTGITTTTPTTKTPTTDERGND